MVVSNSYKYNKAIQKIIVFNSNKYNKAIQKIIVFLESSLI